MVCEVEIHSRSSGEEGKQAQGILIWGSFACAYSSRVALHKQKEKSRCARLCLIGIKVNSWSKLFSIFRERNCYCSRSLVCWFQEEQFNNSQSLTEYNPVN